MKLFAILTALLFSFPSFPASQQASSPVAAGSTQAITLLAQSLASLTGHATLTDVTLSGTARRISGSDDESGAAVFKALASGAGRMDLNLSSGKRSEVSDISKVPAGAWSGTDRVSHPIAFHNLISEPAWFFPAFAIARRLSDSGYVASYVGHETHNGAAVEHISVSQTAPLANPPGGATFEHLTQIDFFLDSATLLPSAIDFNVHPDNNALLDIPVEVQFTDYRAVDGAQVPFHIEKLLNNSLILDFQAQSVTLNTGLAASTFSAQ
jgi:hypothetical protein